MLTRNQRAPTTRCRATENPTIATNQCRTATVVPRCMRKSWIPSSWYILRWAILFDATEEDRLWRAFRSFVWSNACVLWESTLRRWLRDRRFWGRRGTIENQRVRKMSIRCVASRQIREGFAPVGCRLRLGQLFPCLALFGVAHRRHHAQCTRAFPCSSCPCAQSVAGVFSAPRQIRFDVHGNEGAYFGWVVVGNVGCRGENEDYAPCIGGPRWGGEHGGCAAVGRPVELDRARCHV